MIKFLINRPIAVSISLIAFLVLGLISSGLLPVSLLPDVDIPEINVQISKPGMSAQELEKTVVGKIRGQLQQVRKLEDIQSETRDGNAIIRMRFNYGADIDYRFMEVSEQLDAVMANLPRDLERPRVIRASATDIPVFNLNISYKNPKQKNYLSLSEFSESIIKRRVEQIPEVAMADISGLVRPQISVTPDMEALKQGQISLDQIESLIRNANMKLSNIMVKDGYYQYNVDFGEALTSIEDINRLLIKSGDRVLLLGDIAEVKMEARELNGLYMKDGQRAVVLSIIKQSEARVQDMRVKLEEMITGFSEEYKDLNFDISQDQTSLLNASISNLKQNLIYGALLAFLIMFLVLGDLRSPLLMGITIPASIIISMLIFYITGLSINIVSLSGLILGAGMMIDNSIIVIDNIGQYRKRGLDLKEACIKGTNEVIRPLISSVLTTCAVFVPLVFLSNISGALFYDQALAIAIGLGVSLLVSIMILPVFYKLLNQKEGRILKIKLPKLNILDVYEKGMELMFRRKYLFFLLFLLLIPAGYILFNNVDKSAMPEITHNDFRVHIDWNEKKSIEESVFRIQDIIQNFENEIEMLNAFVGEQQFMLQRDFQNSTSEVDLIITTTLENTELLKTKIETYILKKYPQAVCKVTNTRNVFEAIFASNEAPLYAEIKAKNQDGVPQPERLDEILEAGRNTYFEAGQKPPLKEMIRLSLNAERISLYELNSSSVIHRLRTAFRANEIDKMSYNQKMIPLVMGSEAPDLISLLNESFITTKDGNNIPLKWLVDIQHVVSYKTITAGKEGEYIPVNLQFTGKDADEEISKAKHFLHSIPDIDFMLKGTWFKNKLMIREMIFVMGIALLLLFFILAAQFESVVQPLIVLTEVFIDVSGALLLLYLTGNTLNIMSAIGIIVMAGIIINDSIIKVDTINQLRMQGMGVREAIFEAGKRRFNPIIMTSLTTILALVPLFFTSGLGVELQLPLALAVIGGLGLGTLVSLYFIPLFYGIIYLIKN